MIGVAKPANQTPVMVISTLIGRKFMEKTGNNAQHVVVAMSGGVDSSVAAALLVEQGFQVTGVMMRTWQSANTGTSVNIAFDQSLERAGKIAEQLQISFQVVDVTADFRKAVIEYFIKSHGYGVTPNPCFVCNRHIKWGLLMGLATGSGADKLASGHYAQVRRGEDGLYRLFKAVDKEKDQSYVLSGLTQAQLARAMFPLGQITKKETRGIAYRYNFKIEESEESQDLCFLEGQSQEEFLRRYSPDLFVPGVIRTPEGEIIGKHSGLALYTIGQRKGILISHSEPYYVLSKDISTNTLVVGTRSHMGIKRIKVSDVNWVSDIEPSLPAVFQVKVRYRSLAVEAVIMKAQSSGYNITFNESVRDPTPGQYAVFYDNEMVIGSGVIAETLAGEN